MKQQLLISIVSDQTLPNLQLIKELGNSDTDYIFLLSESMEKKGIVNWITTAAGIQGKNLLIDDYSIEEIHRRLDIVDYALYERILVNITGGTKIMILAVFEYFQNRSAEIYYLTGRQKQYLYIHDSVCEQKTLASNVSVTEYLQAYGFDIKTGECCGISTEQTKRLFEKYVSGDFDIHMDALEYIRDKRSKAQNQKNPDAVIVNVEDYGKIEALLKDIEYSPITPNQLSAKEIIYLSGEWFEEYIGARVKSDLALTDAQILIGTQITKKLPLREELNSPSKLLGIDRTDLHNNNEIDVMFVKDDVFYIIECKTSIIDKRKDVKEKRTKKGVIQLDRDGNAIMESKWKDVNILGETIYKSDALKTKFGLYAKSYICTLTDFKAYVQDKNKQNNMSALLKRASVSGIKLVDRTMLCTINNISEIL